MNRDDVLTMKPGRELDALVAEKVMGWTVYRGPTPNHYDLIDEEEYAQGFPPEEDVMGLPFEIETYSTQIRFAWEVVEKFESYKLSKLPDGDVRIKYGGQYLCFINANKNCGYGSTASEAICKAALLATLFT